MVNFVRNKDLPASRFKSKPATIESASQDIAQLTLGEVGEALLKVGVDFTNINAETLTLSGDPLVDFYALEAKYGVHFWGEVDSAKFYSPTQQIKCVNIIGEARYNITTLNGAGTDKYPAFHNIIVDDGTIYHNEVIQGQKQAAYKMGLALGQGWMTDGNFEDYEDYGNHFLIQNDNTLDNPGGSSLTDLFRVGVGPSSVDDYTDLKTSKIVMGNCAHPTLIGIAGKTAQIAMAAKVDTDRVLELGYASQEHIFTPWATFSEDTITIEVADSNLELTETDITINAIDSSISTSENSVIISTDGASIDTTADAVAITADDTIEANIGANPVLTATETTDETILRNPTNTSYLELTDEGFTLGTSTKGSLVFDDGILTLPTVLIATTSVSNSVTFSVSTPSTPTFTFNTVVHDPRSAWSSPSSYTCEFDGYYSITFTAFVIYSPSVTDISILTKIYTGVYSQELINVLASNYVQSWDSRLISWSSTRWMSATDVLTVAAIVSGSGGAGQIQFRTAKLVVNKIM